MLWVFYNAIGLISGIIAFAVALVAIVSILWAVTKSEWVKGWLVLPGLFAALFIAFQIGGWVKGYLTGKPAYQVSMDAVNAVEQGKHLPPSSRMAGILVASPSDTKGDDRLDLEPGSTLSIRKACRTPPGQIPETVIVLNTTSVEVGYCFGAGCSKHYHHSHYGRLLDMRTGKNPYSVTSNSDHENEYDFPYELYNKLIYEAEMRSCPASAKPKYAPG